MMIWNLWENLLCYQNAIFAKNKLHLLNAVCAVCTKYLQEKEFLFNSRRVNCTLAIFIFNGVRCVRVGSSRERLDQHLIIPLPLSRKITYFNLAHRQSNPITEAAEKLFQYYICLLVLRYTIKIKVFCYPQFILNNHIKFEIRKTKIWHNFPFIRSTQWRITYYFNAKIVLSFFINEINTKFLKQTKFVSLVLCSL